MGYIYMLKNKKNGKIYIGQTIRSIKKRFKEHQQKISRCIAIYKAIQKHGWDSFEKDWYECPDEDLNFDEELLVREMETLAPNGYNLREGGGSRGKHSEGSKQKNREAHLGENNHMYGKRHSKETKKKIGDRSRGNNHRYGKTHSKETKQKIGDGTRGKNLSEETKQKLRKPKSKEHKQNMTGENNHKSRRVYQYDLIGTFINSFGSCREAEHHLEKDGSKISQCACGKRNIAYGFKWSYHENEANKFAAR